MPTVIDIAPSRCFKLHDEQTSEEDVLQSISLRFIREVKKQRGSDVAIETINTLSDTLGKQWSSKIIFDILGQDIEVHSTVRVTFYTKSFSATIGFIRAIRQATGMGLKESKDAYDSLRAAIEVAEQANLHSLPSLNDLPYMRIPIKEIDMATIQHEFRSLGAFVL